MTEDERTADDRTEEGASHLSDEQLKLGGLLQALRRLEAGEYGVCTECGGEISVDRLLVFPETSTCVSCSG